MIIIVGVDTSTKMPAYCITDLLGTRYDYGKFTLEPLSGWVELFKQANKVFIEGQYAGINPHSLITLSRASGMLFACAKFVGAEVSIVPPSRWQSNMLKVKHHFTRDKLKRLSKERASELVGENIKDSDIADAIMIAEFSRRRLISKLDNSRKEDNN
ncbi:hypothetical protein MNB_SV-5-1687 [hydrothermal vent metagenome]|uniref:Holliday junction resolvase RuvC n=1 Tax=hydrothermal vent metagenome TaxID=652676 RepID=A0A1W1ECJ2_9ZZZZ